MTTAVTYMRCSGRGQVDGDTWDRQSTATTAFAESHVLEVIHEYREEGVAGKLGEEDRPTFQQMVSDLLANGCRLVLVESLDRLAREYRIQEQLLIYLASKGIELIAVNTGENVTQALMGDPMRRALVQIQGIFAELDKNLVVAKLRKARERKRLAGHRCEGRKPYGTLKDERAILLLMLELRGQGWTFKDIAASMNLTGYNTRSGGRWHTSTVAKILARQNVTAPTTTTTEGTETHGN